MITPTDVEKLAELSRIALAPAEKEGLRADLDSILEYVKEVQNVASDAGHTPDMYLRNVLRNDVVTNETGANTEALLQNAPAREGQYVKVKKIL